LLIWPLLGGAPATVMLNDAKVKLGLLLNAVASMAHQAARVTVAACCFTAHPVIFLNNAKHAHVTTVPQNVT